MQVNHAVADMFERGFLAQPLDTQLAHCSNSPLAPLFLRLFRDQQPVLEAGCGSGKWIGWLAQQGIASDGADWSRQLCARAQAAFPDRHFMVCDLRALPVADETYGGLVALGSIEHCKEGPQGMLREFSRVLQPGGLAVITVPYGGLVRRTRMVFFDALRDRLKANSTIRRVFRKRTGGTTLTEARQDVHPAWWPRYVSGPQGWYWYEYEFNKPQMRAFLQTAGFTIHEEWLLGHDDGIYHNFPGVAQWHPAEERFTFSLLGKALRALLPTAWIGHMLGYVVQKG